MPKTYLERLEAIKGILQELIDEEKSASTFIAPPPRPPQPQPPTFQFLDEPMRRHVNGRLINDLPTSSKPYRVYRL